MKTTTTKKASNLYALMALMILCSACSTSKSIQQNADFQRHDSLHKEYSYTKAVDSLVAIQLHNIDELTVIQETFTPVRDTSGLVTGSVLSARIRIVSRSEKDSTAVVLHSENEEQQQQVSATSDTNLNVQIDEERKSAPPWLFFVFVGVIVFLFVGKLKA
ncbi:hypothetical protein EZS27_003561 [termite gut metagenome]|uniref:Uncharacterized protein n=1 Tax=termite gut metagenome TaxID=433724 RepID=A0A5J4SU20_9ZZZZ